MPSGRARAGFLVLSIVAGVVFWLSPVRDMTDSRFSLLVSENLLRHREFALDRYFDQQPAPALVQPVVKVKPIETRPDPSRPRLPLPQYSVEQVNGHVHYYFPHAGSVLALPYMAAMRAANFSVLDGDGGYLAVTEERLQAGLAAILMGLATGVFYLTALELLAPGPSAVLALLAAFGTQVWSTASRVLWSDTWGVTLLAVVVWMLVAARVRGRALNPYLLGSLLAWMYFVRPTNSVHAALVLGYIVVVHRPVLARVAAAAVLWGLAFVTYSYRTFGTVLPSYFQAGRLGTGYAVESLLANIASPSRGVVFYVPVVPLALVVLWRHWRHVREKDLALLGVAGIAGQLVPLLFFDHWWGGYSYGPRLLTGMVPWALLVAALAARAARAATAEGDAQTPGRWLRRAAIAAICAWSVLVNGRGAVDARIGRWNLDPMDVDASPLRVWDWRRPQFVAGLRRPRPMVLPLGVWMPLGRPAADALFARGWSIGEGEMRWSVSARAALRVRWPMPGPLLLRMRLRPAPAWVASGGQPLALWLDGQELARWHLTNPGPVHLATPVEADGPDREHRLELRVPDVAMPAAQGQDIRPLRTGLYTMRLDAMPVLRRGEYLPLGNDVASRFLGNGWGDPEGSHRWTVAQRADLHFADSESEPAVLRLHLQPFLAGRTRPGQRVLVGLNGMLVGTIALQSEDSSEHAIALIDGVKRANTLSFELPDAVPPSATHLDLRRLGVAFRWLRLDPLPGLTPGRPVALGQADAAAYLGDGWAEPEGTTRWSVGLRSEILFKVDRPGPGRLLLTMEPFLSRQRPSQRVRIDLNDQRLGEIVLDRPGRLPYAIAVPAGALQTHNVLRLILPDASSPASLGLGRDPRMLGVRVGTLELRP
jgi:hypothetical protein